MLSERSRHQLSRVISKNRRLTDRTLPLFLGSGVREMRKPAERAERDRVELATVV